MKNNLSKDLNLIKMIKSLSTGPCAGCVFNKLGKCAIDNVYVHYNKLDSFPEKMGLCNLKLSHEDLANYMVDNYFAQVCVCSDPDSTDLLSLIKSVEIFKYEIGE